MRPEATPAGVRSHPSSCSPVVPFHLGAGTRPGERVPGAAGKARARGGGCCSRGRVSARPPARPPGPAGLPAPSLACRADPRAPRAPLQVLAAPGSERAVMPERVANVAARTAERRPDLLSEGHETAMFAHATAAEVEAAARAAAAARLAQRRAAAADAVRARTPAAAGDGGVPCGAAVPPWLKDEPPAPHTGRATHHGARAVSKQPTTLPGSHPSAPRSLRISLTPRPARAATTSLNVPFNLLTGALQDGAPGAAAAAAAERAAAARAAEKARLVGHRTTPHGYNLVTNEPLPEKAPVYGAEGEGWGGRW